MKNQKIVSGLLLAACFVSFTACGKEAAPAPETPKEPEVVVMTDAVDPVDYTTGVFTWMHYQEGEGETLKILNGIDNCQYGTAGSSLQQASAAAGVLLLTAAEDVAPVLDGCLAAMNTTQRDFFSFQWQMSVKKAKAMLADPAAWQGALSDCGRGDVDPAAYTLQQVEALDQTVLEALRQRGVTDEWKKHLEEQPFENWTES